MKKLGVIVVIVSVVCLTTIAPIFADTGTMVPVNQIAQYPVLTENVLAGSLIVSTSAWNLVSTDVDYEYLYNYTEKTIKSWAYSEQTGTVGNTVGVGNNVVYNSGGGTLGNTSTMQKWNIFERDIIVNVQLTNLTTSAITLSSAYPIVELTSSSGHSFNDISVITSNNLLLRYATAYHVVFEVGEGHYTPSGACALRPGEHVSATVQIKQCTYTTSNNTYESNTVQLPSNDYPTNIRFTNMSATVNNLNPDDYFVDFDTQVLSRRLDNIISSLNNIESAYTSNQSNIDNTQSNINSTDDLVSYLHDQELTYYQQNESALNNVGLSNFSFNSDESSGLGSVVTDFTTLWNNIGPLQIIFTFTLSLSLATYLLKHRPITNAIKKNDKK